ncbi:hypothetical protein LXA43DRAFT_974922 [Ganoderma leucocontextum]|nr:hypothetical protein LXA43DRAFT_974922 [Ganoderma leucocontextum]
MPADHSPRADPTQPSLSAAGPSTVLPPTENSIGQSQSEPGQRDLSAEKEGTVSARSLQANRTGNPVLGSVDTFVGIVAAQAYTAQGWESNIVVTTPNATWIPEFAVAHSEIDTFADGRWGRHEYSRWPQQFARDVFHIHCIPTKPRPKGPRKILWHTLSPADWKPDDCGVPGLGFLDKQLQMELVNEANDTVSRFHECLDGNAHKGWDDLGCFLVTCLYQTMDRLRAIPALPGVIVSLAAHVQRLTLELSGLIEWLKVVFVRVKRTHDCSLLVLDVLGAYTGDPSVAQMLHCAGIPVWLQHQCNTRLEIYKVITATDIPSDFSHVPSYPRLVLANRDLSGALNMPGEWQRAMAAVVRRQLCESQLPELLQREQDGTLPPAKRLREGVIWVGSDSSSLGAAKPVFLTQDSRKVKTLKHDLPPASSVSSSSSNSGPSNPGATTKKPHALDSGDAKGFAVIPSRQYYTSHHLPISSAWKSALSAVSVKYYFAPPWLLDVLDGFDVFLEKRVRIRTFCRVRLFDSTVAGRPLTIAEWRDALWGDYTINEGADNAPGPSAGRPKIRHDLQANVRRLFVHGGALPSYHVDARPQFGNDLVTLDMARSDSAVHRAIVWDAHETNWRCELLALDALMVGSNQWSTLNRWMRESLVSQVWGSGTSGIDVVPSPEHQQHAFCWAEPSQHGWEDCRKHLKAFVEVLGRWEGLPSELRGADQRVMVCNADEYARILEAAVSFYVHMFVAKYERLPVPPMSPPPCPSQAP